MTQCDVNQENQKVFCYAGEIKIRLDKFLVECFPEQSRSRVQAWINEECVLVNGSIVTKNGTKIEHNSTVLVNIPPIRESKLIPEDIPLNIIYEDENLMVVNKEAGMVVHPSVGHFAGTLAHAALAHAPEMEGIGGEHRPGIVHRLDKDTSGLIILAKNDQTHRWLQDQFRNRTVKKFYNALVHGTPLTPEGRIEAPIGRDPNHRKQMAVVQPGRGKDAVSEYKVLEYFEDYSLVLVQILTGRTHQVRLHMKMIGCPIVGDTLYGRRHSSLKIKRQFLHAAQLEICLPGHEEATIFKAPLPADLEDILTYIR
ncbi:MAG: RluA family pseudouridine synthase [Anaerolineaceae bacterium]|nr:RluA family pseudouridine synthase [Anaerolineaceae bacterium]